jgi:hypothetical protein
MIELFPAKYCDEILRCGGSMWAGIVMKHHNILTKRATSLFLDRTTQFIKCVAIDTCVDCWTLRQEFHNQNAFSVPKHCAHNVVRWNFSLLTMMCASIPWTAASMHIFASFIKVSHPSPYHWITHGMFSIHVTKLTMKSASFMSLVFKKEITDCISHTVGFSIFLNIVNAQDNA